MTANDSTAFFLAVGQDREGPFSETEVARRFGSGQVTKDALCWREGTDEWRPLHEVLPELVHTDAEGNNPYAPPSARVLMAEVPSEPARKFGGIRRGAYFWLCLLIGVANNFILKSLAQEQTNTEWAYMIFLVFSTAASLAIVWPRLKNIGMNPWWSLLSIVPVVNLVIAFGCLVCQEGWVEVRRLDYTGRTASWIIGILFVLTILLILFSQRAVTPP